MYKILIALIATFCFVWATSYAQIDWFKFSSVAIKNATMKAKPVAKKNVKPAVVVIAKEIKESGIKTWEMVYRNQRWDVISKDAWEYNNARKWCSDTNCMWQALVPKSTVWTKVDAKMNDTSKVYSCGKILIVPSPFNMKLNYHMDVKCTYAEQLEYRRKYWNK